MVNKICCDVRLLAAWYLFCFHSNLTQLIEIANEVNKIIGHKFFIHVKQTESVLGTLELPKQTRRAQYTTNRALKGNREEAKN